MHLSCSAFPASAISGRLGLGAHCVFYGITQAVELVHECDFVAVPGDGWGLYLTAMVGRRLSDAELGAPPPAQDGGCRCGGETPHLRVKRDRGLRCFGLLPAY